jgi:cellulose synthase/poly-beta-1,6-N-acetylglucosamine synthase-like glycosyltransferase
MTITIALLLLVVLYVQIGYASLMGLLARLHPKPFATTQAPPEAVSIILCVHNEGARIQERLRNLAACEWSGAREILVFCDGCEDDTAAQAGAAGVAEVRIIASPVQRGKWAALNEAVLAAKHPVIVFADVRQSFDRMALLELTRPLQDPAVGAVSGLLEIATSSGGGGRGVDLYWKIECKLREWEGRFDSVIGCTGAIYAIRQEAFQPLAADTILDDVIVPMQIAVAGWRVVYQPQAVAYDPQTLNPAKEKLRKRRTLVGNYQMLERHPQWLLPWHNRLWWQLLSHKYARLGVPWLLLAVLLLTLLAPKTPLVWLLLAVQIICYTLGITGMLRPAIASRLVTIPAGFLLLQWTCAQAFFSYLGSRSDPLSLWRPTTGATCKKNILS